MSEEEETVDSKPPDVKQSTDSKDKGEQDAVDTVEQPEMEAEINQEVPATEPVLLTDELILQGLRSFEPTVDGLQIAPSKFICNKKSLTDISVLERFRYLRYINVAFNNLKDVSFLNELKHPAVLNAARNSITEFPTGSWTSLTHLILDHNRIEELGPVKFPKLKVLSLNHNQLTKLIDTSTGTPYLTDDAFPELHTLELAHNKLYLLEGAALDDTTAPVSLKLNLPRLKALFLNHNQLTSLATYKLCPKPQTTETLDELAPTAEHPEEEDNNNPAEEEDAEPELILLLDEEGSALGQLPELSVLNLRANGLRDLDGLISGALPKLQYLNLRENLITNIEELEKLKSLDQLQTLILRDNPITDIKDYRTDVKLTLQTVVRLDKDFYSTEENEAIAQIRNQQPSAA